MARLLAKPKSRLLVTQVAKRKDVSPDTGEKKYGDVKFADPTNSKYPIDTKEHAKAAWSYINKSKNAAKYSASDLKGIKSRIKTACKKFGVEISADEQAVFEHDPMMEVTQRHYYIDGSYEDHCSKISAAFKQWRRMEEYWDYRWANILGITDTSIYFYTTDWDSTEPEYFEIGYSVEGSKVVINGEVQRVDVKLMVDTLAVPDDDDESSIQGDDTQTGEEQKPMETKQDTVPDESAITDAAVAAPAQIGSPAPSGTGKKTDAETKGSSVEDPAADANSNKPADHSDGEGASEEAADGSSKTAVKEALDTTAPGYKGEPAGTDGTPEPYAGQSDKREAQQGVPYDQAGQSMCYIQKVEKTTGADGKTLMKMQGIATRGDIVNKVGQVYPLSVWEKNLPEMNKQAANGKFIGKLEHPEMEQGLVDTAIKFDRFYLQGSDVWFEATVVPTEPHGKNLQALLEAGVQVDMSTRGYGTFAMQDWRGTERPVMQDDFVCTAIDAVWHGASSGSGVKSTSYQSDPNLEKGEQKPVETKDTTTQSDVQVKAAAIRASAELKQTRAALLGDAGLNELGMKAYQTALDKCDSLENLIVTSETLLPHLQATFPAATGDAQEVTQSATYSPTFFKKQNQEEAAPQNVGELLDRMVADLPDHYEGQAVNPNLPSHFSSPRAACKRLMVNIAREQQGSFSGRNAALGLLALEQGKIDRAQDILLQSLATGATIADGNADGGGAPLSNYLIFPLVRRVFPMYIMGMIASIQPLDRPEGKIFFLDQYRVDGSANETRIDLNTSSNPFNSSFADNATEGSAAMQMRLRLTSALVQAHTKKLGASWSLEEMQDLRAYHGLDAAQELLGGVAREMALEWNKEVLDDMLAQATASALTFGTTIPATGFTQQKDWDEYLWVYLNKLDSAIFSKRNGAMTHIIAGVDAALAMSKSMRGVFTFNANDDGVDGEIYPGTTFYGTVSIPGAGKYKVLRTNFWSTGTTNGSKILGLRKGAEWSDTPYIWAPYTDYVTPMLTDPADFSQKQGIISRAAKKVVVADAMGTITVNSGVGELVS